MLALKYRALNQEPADRASMHLSNCVPSRRWERNTSSFTLIELLVVLCIIAILATVSVPVIAPLLRANHVDQSISTLSGVLDQAREIAISQNTYTWVAFSQPTASAPANGIWVAIIKSQDGSESPINTTVTPAWLKTVTIPGSNLQLVNKLQNLPGVQIVDASAANLPASLLTNFPSAQTNSLFEDGVQWTISPLQYTAGNSSTSYFTKALEFTSKGEARICPTTSSWYSYVVFGMTPSQGSNTNNAALFCVERLTGRTTVYRP